MKIYIPLTFLLIISALLSISFGTRLLNESIKIMSFHIQPLQIDEPSAYVYDNNGKLLIDLRKRKSLPCKLKELPSFVGQAFISIEDRGFYRHDGISLWSIVRASWENLKAGRIVQGASTITQQLARNRLSSFDRTIERKIKETVLAIHLEKKLTKSQILESYLNTIYFGSGYYGIESASKGYFKKSARNLTISEASLLAAIIKYPSKYKLHLKKDLTSALRRRSLVLKNMVRENYISGSEGILAQNNVPKVYRRNNKYDGFGFVFDEIEKELQRQGLESSSGAINIQTSIDYTSQLSLNTTLKNLPLIEGTQIAVLGVDKKTNDIKFMSGSRNYGDSQFNRSFLARRPIGDFALLLSYAVLLKNNQVSLQELNGRLSSEYLAQKVQEIGLGSMNEFMNKSLWPHEVRDFSFLLGNDVLSLREIARIVNKIESSTPRVPRIASRVTAFLKNQKKSEIGNGIYSSSLFSVVPIFKSMPNIRIPEREGVDHFYSFGRGGRNSWMMVDLGNTYLFSWYGIDSGKGKVPRENMRKVLSQLYRNLDSHSRVEAFEGKKMRRYYWNKGLSRYNKDVFLPHMQMSEGERVHSYKVKM